MTSSPKRPWFRFHLLTAVLMMLGAGGIMWLNATTQRHFWPFDFPCSDELPILLANALTWLVILGAIALTSESLIRRREGRKQ